jgi:predicted metal-dependent hydrolase
MAGRSGSHLIAGYNLSVTLPLHRNTIAACERMDAGNPRSRCEESPSTRLLFGIAQFNRREFFPCHETLEAMWLEESDDVRYLYQGILQVGVGYLHLMRGNHHGTVTKLHSGCALLNYFKPSCMGVQVSSLLTTAQTHLELLQELGPERLSEFNLENIPTIIVVSGSGNETRT